PCCVNRSSMWLRNGTGVSMALDPDPSTVNDSLTSVSLVLRISEPCRGRSVSGLSALLSAIGVPLFPRLARRSGFEPHFHGPRVGLQPFGAGKGRDVAG